MEKPLQFISADENGQYCVNEEVATFLQTVDRPVTVVAIAGPYRSGKSFLLNRLFGVSKGFDLGSELHGCTRGFWIWARPHPRDPDRYLVLLDCEGLHDYANNPTHDLTIFSLAILLSNIFIYNTRGTIDARSLDDLSVVTELADHIRVQPGMSSEEDSELFASVFPKLLWVVRDLTLQLKLDGRDCTPDEYLDMALKALPGRTPQVNASNFIKECIQSFFPKRRCFTMCKPVEDDNMLAKLDTLPDEILKAAFREDLRTVVDVILDDTDVLKQQTTQINGRRYFMMAQKYVDDINRGAVPCIGSTISMVQERESERALRASLELYDSSMKQFLPGETLDQQAVSAANDEAQKVTLDFFYANAFLDDKGFYPQELQDQLTARYQDWVRRNEEMSSRKCQQLIEGLYTKHVGVPMKEGRFSQKGGYKLYMEKYNIVLETYSDTPDKGPCAAAVKAAFEAQKEGEKLSVLQSDKKLTKAEKQHAEEAEKARIAEERVRTQEEENRRLQQQSEDERKTFLENICRVEKKAEEKVRELRDQQAEQIAMKDEEMKRLLAQGKEDQARLAEEIKLQMKKDQEESEQRYRKELDSLKKAVEDARKQPADTGGKKRWWEGVTNFLSGIAGGLLGRKLF